MSRGHAILRTSAVAWALVFLATPVGAAQLDADDVVADLDIGGLFDREQGGIRDPDTGHGFLAAQGWGVAMRVDGAWHVACRADGLDCNPLRLQRTYEASDGTSSVERHSADGAPLLEVRHTFETHREDTVVGLVTVRNLGDTTADAVQYRAVWKFAVDPAPKDGAAQGRQLVDVRATSPLAYTSTHGNGRVSPVEDPSLSSGPASDPRYPDTCNGIEIGPGTVSKGVHINGHGPCNNGFMAEAALGALPPGQERSIRVVSTIASSPSYAHSVLRGLADSWAVAYPDDEDVPPATETQAFGVGLRPLLEPPEASFLAEATLPRPLPSTWSSGAVCIDHPVAFLDTSQSDAGLLEARWAYGSGASKALRPWVPIHEHTFLAPGEHLVTLQVTDKAGRTTTSQETLRAVDCGFVPVPNIRGDVVANDCTGWKVTFDGSRSRDVDGQITSWAWDVARQSGTGSRMDVEPAGAIVTARLTVTDEDGKQSSMQRTILRPHVTCAGQLDMDADNHLDHEDTCPTTWNPLQVDADADGIGDACEAVDTQNHEAPAISGGGIRDRDRDGIADDADNCPDVANASQADLDLDNEGDLCDKDLDGDGIVQTDEAAYLDNCPYTPNTLQTDSDEDGIGDACQAAVVVPVGGGPALPEQSAKIVAPLESDGMSPLALAAIGAGLVAAAVGIPAGWRRWAPFVAVGFSRLSGTQVEEHPVRQRILNLLQEKPGLHFHAIVREVDKGRGTVRHHLDVLTKAGMVRVHAAKGFTAFYPGGARIHNVEARTALQSPLAWRILQAACHSPGASVSELSRIVGSRHGTVHHHVQRLRELGLLESQDAGRARALYPSSKGLEILSTADTTRVGLE